MSHRDSFGAMAVVFVVVLVSVGCGGSGGPEVNGGASLPTPVTPEPQPADPSVPVVSSGDLDESFGDDGIARVPLGEDVHVFRAGLRVGGDGRVVVLTAYQESAEVWRLAVVYVPPDGRSASDGVVAPLPTFQPATAVFSDDGGWFAVGWFDDDEDGRAQVARFESGGVLDTGFGRDGFAQTRIRTGIVSTPLRDGGILLLGQSDAGPAFERLGRDGQPVEGFGEGGLVVLPPAPHRDDGGRYELANAVEASDGRLYLAVTHHIAIAWLPVVFAYDELGALDPSFGEGGIIRLPTSWVMQVEIDSHGDLLVLTGHELARVFPDGSVDPTFDPPISVSANGLSRFDVADDGRIFAVGGVFTPDPERGDCQARPDDRQLRRAFVAQSFLPDGTPDPAFAGGGTACIEPGEPYGAQFTQAESLALGPVGELVVAGTGCRRPFRCDLVVLRFGVRTDG